MNSKFVRAFTLMFLVLSQGLWAVDTHQLLPFNALVKDNDGNLVTGSKKFKFALINAAGTQVYWNNEGTTSLPPTASLTIAITNGNLSIMLGDTAISGMAAILDTAFDSKDVYLRVWAENPTTAGQFDQFNSDKKMTAVPYAYVAKRYSGSKLDGVEMGATTPANGKFLALSATSFSLNGLAFPTDKGTSGQVLKTDGVGALSWVTPSGSGDTSKAVNETITGAWTLSGDWINTTHPWADNEVSDVLTLNYGAMTNSTINNSAITNSSISGNTGSFTTLSASGASTLSGAITATAGMNLSGGLTATGTISLGGLTFPSTITGSDGKVLINTGSATLGWMTPISLSNNESITGNWVNTTNPWADNEVTDALTITGGIITSSPISGSTGSFTTLVASGQATLSGNLTATGVISLGGQTYPSTSGTSGQFLTTNGSGTLSWATPAGTGDTSKAANETITGNWVNTANPWADNEVSDALTLNYGAMTNSTINNSAITNSSISGNTGSFTTLTATGAISLAGLTYPAADGTTGQVLKTNGSGALSWVSPTSLTANETITGNWVNSNNPWADDEVANALTISGGTISNSPISGSTGAFTTLDAGATALSSTLTVSGASTLTGAVTANGGMTVSSGLTATGAISLAGITYPDSSVTYSAGQVLKRTASGTSGWGAISATELAADAVTETKIINSAVTSAKILDDTITGSDINSGANVVVDFLKANTVTMSANLILEYKSGLGTGNTLSSNTLYLADTSSANIVYDLPTGMPNGRVYEVVKTSRKNAVLVRAASQLINGEKGFYMGQDCYSASFIHNNSTWSLLRMSGTSMANPYSGLVGRWKLDESSGPTFAEEILGGATLQGSGSGSYSAAATGLYGNGVTFSGASSVITVPTHSSIELAHQLSISVWCKPTSNSNAQCLASKQNAGAAGWALYYNYSNSILFKVSGYSMSKAISPTTGVWHHIVGTIDSYNYKLYLDGHLIANDKLNSVNTAMTVLGDLLIGNSFSNNEYFNGTIDDVRLYNRNLSDNEILEMYKLGVISQ